LEQEEGLVAFVSRFLPGLKKNGGECHHACPFHSDEGESFRIDDSAWRCLVCAEQERFSNDASGFLQAFLGCDAAHAQYELDHLDGLPQAMPIEQAKLRRPCFFGLGLALKRPGVKLWIHDDYDATFAARELIPERAHLGYIEGRSLGELGLPERQYCVLVPSGARGSWERMVKVANVLHQAGHDVRLIDARDRPWDWRIGSIPETHDEIFDWATKQMRKWPLKDNDAAQQSPVSASLGTNAGLTTAAYSVPGEAPTSAAAASPFAVPQGTPELPASAPPPTPANSLRSDLPGQITAAGEGLEVQQPASGTAPITPRAAPGEPPARSNGSAGPPLSPEDRVRAYEAQARAEVLSGMVYTCIADVRPEAVKWLWPGRIPLGELSMIVGDPGLGKSQICASLTSVVTNGGQWPVTRERCDVGSVLILSAEDNIKHTIRPRLDAAGADVQRCHTLQAIKRVAEDGSTFEGGFNLAEDLAKLSVLMDHLQDVRLVIIDPVSAYLGETDSHKNAEVRGMLAPLTTLAGRHRAAIILVSHLTKSQSTNALMRVQGSIAFAALCRAVWGVAADKDNHDRRLFMPLKNNLGQDKTGLAYSIEGMQLEAQDEGEPIPTSRILWESQLVEMGADEAFSGSMGYEERGEMDAAKDFLRELLADGRVKATEAQSAAKQAGHSLTTIGRAKRAMKVLSERDGFGPKATFYWKLQPERQEQESPPRSWMPD
jgi:archaellum biogenesis ATPase FlaH